MTERLYDFASILGEDFCIRWIITMLHFMWQGIVVGLLTWFVASLLQECSSRIKYWLYSVSLLCMPVCVAVTFYVADVPESLQARGNEFYKGESLQDPQPDSAATVPLLEKPGYMKIESLAFDSTLPAALSTPEVGESFNDGSELATGDLVASTELEAEVLVQPETASSRLVSRAARWMTGIYLAVVCVFLLRLTAQRLFTTIDPSPNEALED